MAEGAESAVAGRLEVIVEAALGKFAQELKSKVDEASKGVEAKVGIDLEDGAERTLRDKLVTVVDAAAAGIKATIGLDLDAKSLKAKVEAATDAAASDVNVGVDGKGILAEVLATVQAAQAAAGEIDVDAKVNRLSLFLSAIKAKLSVQRALRADPLVIPAKLDEKDLKRSTFRLRGFIRGSLVLGLVSLIQPLLGAVSQLIAGLTAITAAALPAVNTLAGLPIVVSAFIQAMVGGKLAMQGFGAAFQLLLKQQKGALSDEEAKQLNQALGELSPSAGAFAKKLAGLRDDWVKTRKVIQEPLFKALNKEIEPLAKVLLPVLEKGLAGTSTVFGGFVTNASKFLQSPAIQKDLGTIMGTNNGLIKSFGTAIGSVVAAFIDFSVAAKPFTDKLGQTIEKMGEFWQNKAAKGRQSGSTVTFLERATERLSMVWELTKNVIGGFKGIFKAADEAIGKKMLGDFTEFTGKWDEWANSEKGQNRLKEFFKNSEGGFHETILLIKDATKAFLKMGEDPGIAKLIKQIRTEFGPALNGFLTEMAQTSGPAVVQMLTSLVKALDALAPVTKGVADFIKVFADMIAGVADLVAGSGDVGKAILHIAGYVVAWKLLTKVPLLGGLITSLTNLNKASTTAGTTGAAGVGRMGTALKGIKGGLTNGGLALGALAFTLGETADKSTAGGRALSAFGRIAGGALAGFSLSGGNPIGAGVGAAVGALSLLPDMLKKTKDEVKDLTPTILDFADSLDQVTGAVTKTTRTNVLAELVKGPEWEKTKAIIDNNNINMRDVIDAALGSKEAEKRIEAILGTSATGVTQTYTGINAAGQLSGGSVSTYKYNPTDAFLSSIRTDDIDKLGALGAEIRTNANSINTLQEALAGLNKKGLVKSVEGVLNANAKNKTVFSGKQLAGLKEQFKLGPNQTKQVARAVSLNDADYQRILTQFRKIKKAKADAAAPPKNQGGPKAGDTVAPKNAGLPTPKQMREATGGLAAEANKVPTKLARAIASGKGKVKTAASTMVSGAENTVKASVPKFSTYGKNMSQGLANGMNANLAEIRAAATAMAAEADKAVRAKAQIQSPSKVMKRLGRYIGEGFTKGILGTVKGVRRASVKLFSMVTEAKGKGFSRALKFRLNDEIAQLSKYAKRREAIAKKLAKAREKLEELRGKKQGLIDTLKSAGEDYGSVSNIAGDNGGFASPAFLVGELNRRLANMKAFSSALTTLRKRGIGEAIINQIASMGIDGGLQLARQLLTATPAQVKEIKAVQDQINTAANAAGTSNANALYNAGIQAAAGLVRGLESKSKELEKVAKKLAQSVVKQIKKELKIKSPSRVTMAMGAFTTKGLSNGLESEKKGLLKRARKLSTDLAKELQPTSLTYGPSKIDAKRVAAARAALSSQANDASHEGGYAPLIGELSLTAGTPADAREVLDEAIFALRKIKNGGIHADRVA